MKRQLQWPKCEREKDSLFLFDNSVEKWWELVVMQERANFSTSSKGEAKPCTERREGSFGGKCRKNSIHTPKLDLKGKFIKEREKQKLEKAKTKPQNKEKSLECWGSSLYIIFLVAVSYTV